ncbi:unnamed protein product [Nezara viridula]|uniref:Mitochondrial ribosomal protein S17 n=1 Tax=Nezara viridula TaxID=85310 RepID=A0A9P0HLJ0_NEZVI|nr:unnamed protein product [Nezara viridula]
MSAKKAASLLLAKCMPSVKENASKFTFSKLELDENLHMYFKKLESCYAYDPDKICKTGDIVLIQKLPQKMSKLITHKVLKVVYPLGDVVDPISGKKVVGYNFRDDICDVSDMYGKNPEAFDYQKAPPRGWQEGKKDFTDKETYYKYQDDENDFNLLGEELKNKIQKMVDIPVIPDVEELQDDDQLGDIADAPVVSTNVPSLSELNADLKKQSLFKYYDNINMGIISKHLFKESEIREEDNLWSWDLLFTEVSSELRSEWEKNNSTKL